ncbi:unnamed protein product, partial [Rotaria sordida]
KINTIYQYFTDLSSSSSSSSSKKSSASSVSTTNKKQTNSSVTTNEEGTINSPSSQKDQQYPRCITKFENFFDSKLGFIDLGNHIPLHIIRLQQFENQLKQQQSYLTNKKILNEIIKFIQNKFLFLFNEDLIL